MMILAAWRHVIRFAAASGYVIINRVIEVIQSVPTVSREVLSYWIEWTQRMDVSCRMSLALWHMTLSDSVCQACNSHESMKDLRLATWHFCKLQHATTGA